MGEVIQLQGDQRKDVQEFLVDKKEGLELDAKTIKVCEPPILVVLTNPSLTLSCMKTGPWVLNRPSLAPPFPDTPQRTDRSAYRQEISFQ